MPLMSTSRGQVGSGGGLRGREVPRVLLDRVQIEPQGRVDLRCSQPKESGAHARDHRLMSVFVFKDSSAEEDSTWSMPLMSARAGEERWSGKVTAPLRMRCLVASSVSAWNGVQPHSISYTA